MSDVFRFHRPTGTKAKGVVKLLKKRKPQPQKDPIPIAADTTSITDEAGTRPIQCYDDQREARYITLTRKESDLIALANPGKRPPAVLEEVHPWLPLQVFREDSKANLKALKSILKLYGQHLITPGAFCDQKWNTICNSARRKTDHDARFYLAWHLPIQDAFILEETRPDRRIIAIDFNSMYASCMQHEFPKPSTLNHVILNRDAVSREALPCGLYRCLLHPPTSEFIKKHNPFRSFFAGRYLGASLDEPLSVDLNEFEIEFFQRHFKRLELIDGVVSEQPIPHPLAHEVRRSYARRMNYLAHDNKPLADREKFLLTLLSSSAHRPRITRKSFESHTRAFDYLKEIFGIVRDEDFPVGIPTRWLDGRKGFTLRENGDRPVVYTPDLFDGSACFEFNQRIVARSRTTLLGMMERLTQSDENIDICYANIDSIHFSLPVGNLDSTLEWLRSEATSQLGGFKIEAVARSGLWLEPGRYWLFSEKVERSRNCGIPRRHGPFSDHSVHVAVRKIGELYIPIRMNVGMDRTLSDARTILGDGSSSVVRQCLVEVGTRSTLDEVLGRLESNRRDGIPRRMHAFRKLREKFQDCGVTLPRDPAK